MGLTTPHLKKNQSVTKCYTGPQTWTASLKRPKQRKIGIRFGTWNARSLYRAGSLAALGREEEYTQGFGKKETRKKTYM
jgi:hypothetical protein